MDTTVKFSLWDAGILLLGFALAPCLVYVTSDPDRPYPRTEWIVDRIGQSVTAGLALGIPGALAIQWGVRGRREPLRTGEWLALIASSLILLAVGGTGRRWLLGCLAQLPLSIASIGVLAARPFARMRPGAHTPSPWTDTTGLLFCSISGPFAWWQFAHGLTYL